jgi:hypothetical protein
VKAYHLCALGLLAAAVSACGGDDASMMSDYTQDLGRHLDEVQAEHKAHSSEVAAASDIESINRAEDIHRQRMDDHMSQTETVMGHMMSCTDARGAHFDGAPFAGMMHDMRSECDDHRTAMHVAATIDSARTEESRHQDAMRERHDKMRGQMGVMMGQRSGFNCPHGM